MKRPEADRSFHLQQEFPMASDPRSLYDMGQRPFWEVHGSELFVNLVTQMRKHQDMRVEILSDMRRAWWQIRYQRKGALKTESGRAAIRFVLEGYELLWWAGYRPFDLHMLTNCLSHGCTCDGCDLAGGERFNRHPPEDWIGNPVTALGHGGGSAP